MEHWKSFREADRGARFAEHASGGEGGPPLSSERGGASSERGGASSERWRSAVRGGRVREEVRKRRMLPGVRSGRCMAGLLLSGEKVTFAGNSKE